MNQLLLLEFNEINFESIEYYIALGKLPTFGTAISRRGYCRTVSEHSYEEVEPWIQWVSAHTGRNLAEHSVFRLGDIVSHEIPQIWEQLEEHGLKVGAVSPMNAKNRTRQAAFFVPDPWTNTEITGSTLTRGMYRAISQVVGDNAKGRLDAKSVLWLLAGLVSNAQASNYASYVDLAARSVRKRWCKAMFLDLVLSDFLMKKTRRHQPNFATLFLNAGAHIQHHYMFSSAAYKGTNRNPEWYVGAEDDPVFEVYALYDRILGQVQKNFPNAHIMIATGLHQVPYTELAYYWRLKNHAEFLQRIGAEFDSVAPRMSRDFVVRCGSKASAATAEATICSVYAEDGLPLFEVDNQGKDLFIMLTYDKKIDADFEYKVGEKQMRGLENDVVFVAIKNGQHHGTGYFLDLGAPKGAHGFEFALTALPTKIHEALGIQG